MRERVTETVCVSRVARAMSDVSRSELCDADIWLMLREPLASARQKTFQILALTVIFQLGMLT